MAPIGWAGQVSWLEAGRERQSVRAPAVGPGFVRPEGPGGSRGPETRPQHFPTPTPRTHFSPGFPLGCSAHIETGNTSAL